MAASRTGAEFSPTPAVNATASTRPSTAAYAPMYFFSRWM
ncbi:hypothetical protein SMICM304S_01776 [Streptomyces microflavus]